VDNRRDRPRLWYRGCGIAYVGDSPAHYVEGPQRAGLRGIWLNRLGLPCPPRVRPDAEVSTLADLPAALARAEGDVAVDAGPRADRLRGAHPAG
jgi:hypothetical protein